MGATWLEHTACGLLSALLGPVVCGPVGFLFICFAFPGRQVEIICDFTVSYLQKSLRLEPKD